MAALLQPIRNQLLQAEMSDHLRTEPGERTIDRRGWLGGSYERRLTTRVGTLSAGIPAMEVPWEREGTFQTARYQRLEKTLVLVLMQMVNADLMRSTRGVSTLRVKKITTKLYGRGFSRQTVSRLAEGPREQVEAWAERSLGALNYPLLVLDATQMAMIHRLRCGGKEPSGRRPCCSRLAPAKPASGRS